MGKLPEKQMGFTLVELLVVIGILTILLTIVLVAINPSRQFSQANDVKRRADVTAILNAISQYAADNKGNLSTINDGGTLPASATNISNTEVDICSVLVPTYIAELPYDPTASGAQFTDCTDYDLQYEVYISATSSRVTVEAPNAENGTIKVTR